MVSLTVGALLVNAQHEQTSVEHQKYKAAMEENEAHWEAKQSRYTLFDTLKAESSPRPVSYELQGHWQLEKLSNTVINNTLLVIGHDGQQTQFRYENRHECYLRQSELELVYYGGYNMIIKDGTRESRHHYEVTPDDKLNIEDLYINGGWGVTTYSRIDSRDARAINYCDADNR